MAITESLENRGINTASVSGFHPEKQASSASASNMESLVTSLVATLNTGSHILLAYIAFEAPATLGNLFNILYRFHKSHVGNGDFGYPEGTE